MGEGEEGGTVKTKNIKNLDWEILIKNLVTFKRWDKVKDEKIEYFQGAYEKLIYRRELAKKGGLGQFAGLRGRRKGVGKNRRVFLRGGYPNAHYVCRE